MSVSFPRLAAAAMLFAGAITVGVAAPAFAENSPTNTPIAVDDAYAMNTGTTLTVDAVSGILANDLHAAAWTITFVEAVKNDVAGELSYDMWGGFSYTPAAGFHGVRTFEYQVRDGDLGVVSDNWGLVTITVVDLALPCEAGTPGCGPTGDLPPCDPNDVVAAPDPGTPATCIPGDPTPGDGTDLPCAAGTAGCIPSGDLPPCDPDDVVAAPAPGTPATCTPGIPTPGDGTDLPCAVGAPGCEPTDIPAPGIPAPDIPATGDDTPVTSTVTPDTQLETLAYTGSNTVDYRLAALAALLLASGVVMLAPRRKKA